MSVRRLTGADVAAEQRAARAEAAAFVAALVAERERDPRRARITTPAIARLLSVSPHRARRMCERGELTSARRKSPNHLGSPWTAVRGEVEEMARALEARRASGETAAAEAGPPRARRRQVKREPLLTAKDVGAQLGVSAATVREWVRQGLFPGAKVFAANTLRFPPEAVRAFVERNRIGAKS